MSEKKASGLGRGLAALLDEAVRTRPAGEEADNANEPSRGVREIEIGRIRPNPSQPRMRFDEDSIAELALD